MLGFLTWRTPRKSFRLIGLKLAAVSSGLSHFKENLVKELKYNGYEVGQLNLDKDEVERMSELIEKYDVAIHMLSDKEEVQLPDGKGMEEWLPRDMVSG